MLLLTRPRAAAERFAAQLPPQLRYRLQIEIAPLAQILPTRAPVPDPDGFDYVVFTSENGAQMLGGAPRALPAWCVGARTADVANGLGYRIAHVAPDVAALLTALKDARPKGRGLYARGVQVSRPLVETLAQHGLQIDEVMLYRQAPCDWEPDLLAQLGGRRLLAPLFSPHIARRFRAAIEGKGLDVCAITFSPSVAEALGPDFAGEILTCASPDAGVMVEAIEGLLDAWGTLERGGSPS
ncbi:uroporphyrinogen-III synthase [Pseudoruegeria sp. SHC-113]|uniref:uroporphyrinogen-III synthase n=1 Tax=Pseudoruegeria sp. SHC-113 TaxID=2855439 RepID=UPI0021BAE45F|nr:uroporphyrinogen-III synthase [Pseudoruegeria sp. SHC-113]MCT8158617.1 uroporphyrinogen-III synthase [Pseudoruegeria sp. SHC-113]